jgi:hypothetical protein
MQNEISRQNGRNSLAFCCFLSIDEKSRKNGLKVKAIALLFAVFYPFTKKEKNC